MNEEKNVIAAYNLELSDLKTAFVEYFFTSVRNMIQFVLAIICFLACFIGVIYFYITVTGDFYAGVVLFLLGVFFLYFIIRPLLTIRRIQLSWQSTRHIPKDFTWEFLYEHIIYTRKFSQMIYPWNHFIQIVEQKSAFCFYESIDYYRVIPKRCFSDEQLTQIRSMIRFSAEFHRIPVKFKG